MTQLIENKPPRRALIATLLHFDDPTTVVVLPNRGLPGRRRVEPGGPVQRESKDRPRLSHRCFVGRSFSSDITDDARSAYRCAPLFAEGLAAFRRAACIRSFDRSSKSRNSNRNIRRLETHLTLGRSTRNPFLIATKLHIVKLGFISPLTFGFEAKGVAFEFREDRDGGKMRASKTDSES
jgi:hypothetical protein